MIALGNGTACRETERWISDMFKDGVLDSEVVQYSIVTEQGASIYSCGDVARKEFPDLDVNLISAGIEFSLNFMVFLRLLQASGFMKFIITTFFLKNNIKIYKIYSFDCTPS